MRTIEIRERERERMTDDDGEDDYEYDGKDAGRSKVATGCS